MHSGPLTSGQVWTLNGTLSFNGHGSLCFLSQKNIAMSVYIYHCLADEPGVHDRSPVTIALQMSWVCTTARLSELTKCSFSSINLTFYIA
eukprot:c11386_g1_i3 orf=259-528(-)